MYIQIKYVFLYFILFYNFYFLPDQLKIMQLYIYIFYKDNAAIYIYILSSPTLDMYIYLDVKFAFSRRHSWRTQIFLPNTNIFHEYIGKYICFYFWKKKITDHDKRVDHWPICLNFLCTRTPAGSILILIFFFKLRIMLKELANHVQLYV